MKKLIIALTLLLTTFAFAEHDHVEKESKDNKFNFWWEQVPAVCSTSDEIERWAEFKKFTPVNMSFGREGGVPEGEIVYIVVYWMNEDQESFASVSTPQRPDQTCIVFRTFDMKLNTDLLNKKDI
tara:strand:+ start:609 stop:983 length:375 start_codon:yes stop_codon:yes gene_type:complete